MSAVQLQIPRISDGVSLKARASAALRAAIHATNIYAPGANLRLDERDLALRFGISRTPLREALAQLETEGLIRIEPRRGIYIVRKTKAELLDMITVWAALESMAARQACAMATARAVRDLHPLVDRFAGDTAARRLVDYSDANIAFHQAIIRLAKSPLIESSTDALFFHVRAMRQRTIGELDRAERSVRDHQAIVAALEVRDADAAERLVRDHTLRLRDHVAAHVTLD